LKIFIVEFVGL